MLQASKDLLDAGKPLSADQIADRQALRDCIPWLRNIIRQLNDALIKANINILDIEAERNAPRGGMARPDVIARIEAALAEALAETRAQLRKK